MRRILSGATTVLPPPFVPSRRDEIEREAQHLRDMRIRVEMLAERAATMGHFGPTRRTREDDRRGVNGGAY